jgi:hypothetical protein
LSHHYFLDHHALASANTNTYSEGDFFAVPLKTGGFGLGIAVCIGSRGTVVGRFFGPVRDSVPTLDGLENLTENDAAHIEHFRDDGLRDGSWKVIGQHPEWDVYDWPIPKFGLFQSSSNEAAGQHFEIELDENLKATRQKKISVEQFEKLPPEGISGAKATEVTLTLVLTRPGWKRKG